jgi:hypothetical protein
MSSGVSVSYFAAFWHFRTSLTPFGMFLIAGWLNIITFPLCVWQPNTLFPYDRNLAEEGAGYGE